MDFAKWLQTATSTTKLTHSFRLARLVRLCFIKNAHNLASLGAAFALAGDCHTIVFTPGYQSTVEAAAHAGGNVTRVQLSPSNGWQINVDDVLAAIKLNETKYLVINEPYNPAGTLMSKALQAELVSVCAEHGIRIMSDEVYRLLEHDPEIRLPSMAEAYELGISCVTMSKPWGACGVTIGWLAFQDLQIKQKLTDAQYFGTACPARSSEIQAMMVLRSSEKILAKNMKIINANVCSLSKFVAKYSEFFSWVKPVAGAIAFIKCEVMTSDELGKELAARGIGIKPCYCFTDEVTVDNEGYFRVGFGEEVKFPIALKALEEFVETVLKK